MSEEIGKFSLKFAGNTYTSENNGERRYYSSKLGREWRRLWCCVPAPKERLAQHPHPN